MNKRSALYAAAGLVLILVWYFFLFSPVAAQHELVREEAAQAETLLDDYNRTIKELPAFLRANESLESVRGQLNSSLFAKGDILELCRQLSQDAADHRLKLVQISPPVEELLELNRRALAENEPQFLNISLDLEGRYIDLGRYVSYLEARPYFRAINTCVIRGNPVLQPTVDMVLSFKALIGTVEEPA